MVAGKAFWRRDLHCPPTLSEKQSMKSFSALPSFAARCLILTFMLSGLTSSTTHAAGETVVLSGVRLIDGTGQPARGPVDIFLNDGKITEVVSTGTKRAPAGTRVVDCQGKTVIPGLISAHSHVGQINGIARGPENYTRENILRQLRQYEAYGVTTVVSLGTNQPLFYAIREEVHAGRQKGADLFGADRGIGVLGGAPGGNLLDGIDQIDRPQNAEEARTVVREVKARGADLIKMWVDSARGTVPRMRTEVFTAVIDEAHRLGLRVTAHIFNLADAKELVDAGIDVIAHGVRDQPVDEAFIKAMKEKSVWYIPTLSLDEAFFIYADRPDWIDQPFFRHAVQPDLARQIDDPQWRKETLARKSMQASREALRMNQRNLAVLHAAGVKIGFGTDSGAFPLRIPGFAEHRELFLMVQAGLSPEQAITIATGQTAALLHLSDRGELIPGRLADLIILETDPSDDITRSQQIHSVWHRGQQVSGPVTGFTP